MSYCVSPFNKRNHEKTTSNLSCLDEDSVNFLKSESKQNITVNHKICGPCRVKLKSFVSDKNIQNIETAPNDLESKSES